MYTDQQAPANAGASPVVDSEGRLMGPVAGTLNDVLEQGRVSS
jgi:hypothetical protein